MPQMQQVQWVQGHNPDLVVLDANGQEKDSERATHIHACLREGGESGFFPQLCAQERIDLTHYSPWAAQRPMAHSRNPFATRWRAKATISSRRCCGARASDSKGRIGSLHTRRIQDARDASRCTQPRVMQPGGRRNAEHKLTARKQTTWQVFAEESACWLAGASDAQQSRFAKLQAMGLTYHFRNSANAAAT